jgi:hypothetical protein
VAEYLDEMMFNFGCAMTGSEIVAFCRQEGYLARTNFSDNRFNLAKLAQCLTTLKVQNLRRSLGPISQDMLKWAWLDRPGYVRRCPNHIWRVDKRTGEIYDFYDDCNSRLCARGCGLARAERDLLSACRRLQHVEGVWHAVVADEEKLIDRLKKRHSRRNRGGGFLWVRRSDTETVHFFATSDLSGRDEPRNGEWLTRSEALGLLATEVLSLPGVERVTFSGSWKRPGTLKKEATTFRLAEGPADLIEPAIDRAERQLRDQHGIWNQDLTPEQVDEVWVPLLKLAVDEQWEIRMTSEGE